MRGASVDRKSQIIVASLLAVLGFALLLAGPGRDWAEQLLSPPVAKANTELAADTDGMIVDDGSAQDAPMPPIGASVVIQSEADTGGGVSDHDPLMDDPINGPPPPRDLRRARESAEAAERRARALSGLDDGDLSTTGDLAF